MTNQNAYANAGVDVAAGEQAVDLMGNAVAATYTPQVLSGIGGFGAAFALGNTYRYPVLISERTALAQSYCSRLRPTSTIRLAKIWWQW